MHRSKGNRKVNRSHSSKFPPRIIIQFNAEHIEGDILHYDYRRYLKPKELDRFEEKFPNLKIEQLFISFTAKDRMELDKKDYDLDYKKRLLDLLTYFTIVCTKPVNPTDVLMLLKEFRYFKQAYIAPVPGTPMVTLTTIQHGRMTEPSSLGGPRWDRCGLCLEIDSKHGVKGGDGGGPGADLEKLVDIEQGWMLVDGRPSRKNHGDITMHIGIDGDNHGNLDHGTACLGIVIASDQEQLTRTSRVAVLGSPPM